MLASPLALLRCLAGARRDIPVGRPELYRQGNTTSLEGYLQPLLSGYYLCNGRPV